MVSKAMAVAVTVNVPALGGFNTTTPSQAVGVHCVKSEARTVSRHIAAFTVPEPLRMKSGASPISRFNRPFVAADIFLGNSAPIVSSNKSYSPKEMPCSATPTIPGSPAAGTLAAPRPSRRSPGTKAEALEARRPTAPTWPPTRPSTPPSCPKLRYVNQCLRGPGDKHQQQRPEPSQDRCTPLQRYRTRPHHPGGHGSPPGSGKQPARHAGGLDRLDRPCRCGRRRPGQPNRRRMGRRAWRWLRGRRRTRRWRRRRARHRRPAAGWQLQSIRIAAG